MAGERILYILPQPYLLPRGSSFRAMATVNALADLGYQVDLLCYPLGVDPSGRKYTIERSRRPPLLRSVKVGPSPQKIFFDIPLACQAHRLLRTRRHALIHGVEEAGFIAGWLGRKFRVPYIFDMHSWMSQQLEDGGFIRIPMMLKWFRRFEQNAMRRAKAIVTVGPEMTEILRRDLAPDVYAATLPDCPLMVDGLASPAMVDDIGRRFFASGRKSILYTGNFHPYQGIDLLLESFRELRLVAPEVPVTLLLVGGGAGEAEKVAFYQKKCQELGIIADVIFCGEHPPEAMPVFIDKADLLVSSRITGNNVPLKVYTYLASGKLLLATDIPSHTQVLTIDNCLLAAPNPVAMAAAMRHGLVTISLEEKERLSVAARRQGGVEQFQKFTDILDHCYRHCLV